MIQIKKTILTLVALLAVTTGAWADETLLLTINSRDYESFTGGSKTFDDKVTITFSNSVDNDGDDWGWYADGGTSLLTMAGIKGYTITSCKFYVEIDGPALTGYTVEGESPSVYLNNREVFTDASKSVKIGAVGITKIEVYGTAPSAASSGPTVAWTAASKTGTFGMPGGNVELEPEYYPQATLTAAPTPAEGAKATTDDLLVSGGTVATITGSDPAAPQGTLMYYVSTTTMSTEALLALDADKWVAEPTAAGITQKCGAFVYYYVKGNDSTDDALNFSDGDISSDNFLNVPIFPAPTYAVTFAEGTDEPTKWTASPATDVTKGETVTVTYTGSKKVIGVKAEKKAAAAVLTITVAKGSTDLSGDKLLYYTPGETYRQAIANHPENKLDGGLGWNIWDGGSDATIFYKESADKSRDLSIDGDQHFHPTDSINLDTVIDPTLNFYFVAQF